MRKTIAYFHLPGLFEAYAFYRVFLPLFFEHREYFYDWCAIGSLYGAPADCIWGGGRVGSGERSAQEVLALTRAYGLSARLTFSNSLLRPEHLRMAAATPSAVRCPERWPAERRHRPLGPAAGLPENQLPAAELHLLDHQGPDKLPPAPAGAGTGGFFCRRAGFPPEQGL